MSQKHRAELAADVAYLLAEPARSLATELHRWSECEEARHRAAISRAYYAVFSALKELISEARRDRQFPRHDVHRKLREALESTLGTGHDLVQMLRTLLLTRKQADYDHYRVMTESDAAAAVDTAYDALDAIDGLSRDDMRRVADALVDLDRFGYRSITRDGQPKLLTT